ncbi:LOW QUALITY PROTEIN: zf-RVT domain-containing protein, partial [Cephalotus follicularis]
KRDILCMVQFSEGVLPVTYLGLPLITKRLTKNDCNPLVERIMARASSWVSKSLSFAGRLQLVKATLASMQTYWSSIFLLPKYTIKCERALRVFLWGGQGRGKVKWAEVCKPEMEDSLWVKWCHAYLLNTSNFWITPIRGLLSWSWRQILLLRPLAREHLIYKCGNGERFSLWFDPWLQGDSIHARYGRRVMYDTGLGSQARVKDVLSEGQWCWPQVSGNLMEIQQRVGDIPTSTNPDTIFWAKVGDSFSTSRAWCAIRTRSNIVEWHELVWHPKRIPKHAFSLWLAIRGAHRTRDKLVTMGVTHTALCVFHCGENESVEHLFFQCPFSATV